MLVGVEVVPPLFPAVVLDCGDGSAMMQKDIQPGTHIKLMVQANVIIDNAHVINDTATLKYVHAWSSVQKEKRSKTEQVRKKDLARCTNSKVLD